MDSLTIYRQAICAVLKDYDFIQSSKPDIETQVLIDRDHDHYQLMRIGWDGSRRVYGTTLHFNIKDGKVWIQHNMTDSDVAAELIDHGVPREDIVLGLQPPYKRTLSGYAVV